MDTVDLLKLSDGEIICLKYSKAIWSILFIVPILAYETEATLLKLEFLIRKLNFETYTITFQSCIIISQ